MDKERFAQLIKNFDFKNLFIELGWDNFNENISIMVDDSNYEIRGIVEKRGFAILQCIPTQGTIPIGSIRKKIEHKISRIYHEHLIIYSDDSKQKQIWQFIIEEKDKK